MKPFRVSLAALALTGLLAGCSAGGAATTQQSTSGGSQPVATSTSSSSSKSGAKVGSANSAEALQIAPDAPAIASSRTNVAYKTFQEAQVDLVRLERNDKLLMGTFRITVKGGEEKDSVYDVLGGTGFKPKLVDGKNLKAYRAIDEITHDSVFTDIVPDGSMFFGAGWAYPEGAEKVDIMLGGPFAPMQGVELP